MATYSPGRRRTILLLLLTSILLLTLDLRGNAIFESARNGFDKAEYNRQYMRRKRAKAKAAREAAKENGK